MGWASAVVIVGARQLADLGAVMGGGVDTDRASLSLRTLAERSKRDVALAVLREVLAAAGEDRHCHALLLPSDAHREINALQRASTICLQKSTREGFGLTVTEAMWKGKPVIGGDTGGIRLQVINHHTGFLVNTPEGAALRVRYLLKNRDRLEAMGRKAREFVLDNFLVTRHLREYLTLMFATLHKSAERIEL